MHFFERGWEKRWHFRLQTQKEHHVSQRSALKLKTTNKRK